MTYKSNSVVPGSGQWGLQDCDEYRRMTAEPAMAAIDTMPKAYKALVNEYGYIDVYRAWRRGMQPWQIEAAAKRTGGFFRL